MKGYARMMEDIFNDIGTYTDAQKREIVYPHVKQTKDPLLIADLALYQRAAESYPQGPEFSYKFLKAAMRRRTEETDREKAMANRTAAREKQFKKYQDEAKQL